MHPGSETRGIHRMPRQSPGTHVSRIHHTGRGGMIHRHVFPYPHRDLLSSIRLREGAIDRKICFLIPWCTYFRYRTPPSVVLVLCRHSLTVVTRPGSSHSWESNYHVPSSTVGLCFRLDVFAHVYWFQIIVKTLSCWNPEIFTNSFTLENTLLKQFDASGLLHIFIFKSTSHRLYQ